MSERKTSFIFERGEKMTRRELRENVFKMLFRVEFFDAGELPEQLELFGEEVDHVTDQDFKYMRLWNWQNNTEPMIHRHLSMEFLQSLQNDETCIFGRAGK